MSLHTLNWTFEEIGKGENKTLEVDVDCYISPGHPGSYWEPPEPTEVEFLDVTIMKLLNEDGEITVAPSWQKTLKQIALDLVEDVRDRFEQALFDWLSDADESRGC